jgi:hypothetical protein
LSVAAAGGGGGATTAGDAGAVMIGAGAAAGEEAEGVEVRAAHPVRVDIRSSVARSASFSRESRTFGLVLNIPIRLSIGKGSKMQWNRIRPMIALTMLLSATPVIPAEIALDYDYFKIQVEPIFLKQRPDHGRCYVCHTVNNSAFRLEKLAPGSQAWTEEQTPQCGFCQSGMMIKATELLESTPMSDSLTVPRAAASAANCASRASR